jgi:glycosyltransferase involved in cell wall biosynthesis
VDPERFGLAEAGDDYAHRTFEIPRDRAIVYYAGHFEPRKGVDVILRAARELVDHRGRRDVHFLLTGNRPEDRERLWPIVAEATAAGHVTFAGYRTDAPRLTATSRVAVIASTGWDSFPMTSLEAASCGLPLVASRLQGLVESVADGQTGYLFTPGNHVELADRLQDLLDNPMRYESFRRAARARVLERFTRDHQLACLSRTIRGVLSSKGASP